MARSACKFNDRGFRQLWDGMRKIYDENDNNHVPGMNPTKKWIANYINEKVRRPHGLRDVTEQTVWRATSTRGGTDCVNMVSFWQAFAAPWDAAARECPASCRDVCPLLNEISHQATQSIEYMVPMNEDGLRLNLDHLYTRPGDAYADWQDICHDVDNGLICDTYYEDLYPKLPSRLEEARDRLIEHVPDEEDITLEKAKKPWNGPRYHLRNVIPHIRRNGERSYCQIEFGKSDYRTFLVTNGLEGGWVEKAGLENEWSGRSQWVKRWQEYSSSSIGRDFFFENSFGINVLVTVRGNGNERNTYAIFRVRKSNSSEIAIRMGRTGGSCNEGLRRAHNESIFDQKSTSDVAPDVMKACLRGLSEELGLNEAVLGELRPKLLSVGRVRSIAQPAALFYLPLEEALTIDDLKYLIHTATDAQLEFEPNFHQVLFDREHIVEFIRRQEKEKMPVESWVIAMAMLSLEYAGKQSRYPKR